ncbi:hypothetical protein T459_27673 [Capsicum annuum]|uniref:Protein kinase domain-containing protein n=1 Tax=Capsicum annuum TaxID=4072 RepID=A0A2G2YEL8_CAPAN|nr:hypothetical protein T459_27673 [Capsicum annuum]
MEPLLVSLVDTLDERICSIIDEKIQWETINHRSPRHPNIIRFKEQVCHRDLKLENTLLDGSPAPWLKICDFGYSKRYESSSNNNLDICYEYEFEEDCHLGLVPLLEQQSDGIVQPFVVKGIPLLTQFLSNRLSSSN